MKKTLTNFDMIQILNILSQYENKKLPQRISYAIVKNSTAISSEYQIYKTQLEKIIKELRDIDKVVLDEDGEMKVTEQGLPMVKEEYAKEFQENLTELLNLQVDVDVFFIDEEVFNYEDSSRYDAMSATDIFNLKLVLCDNEKSKGE